MTVLYPAHIHPDDKTKEQSCTEHSRNTAQYAGKVLEAINLHSSAYLSGLLHDCGKFKKSFQDYLRAAGNGEKVHRGSVTHTFTGVQYLLNYPKEKFEPWGDLVSEILAYAVGAHHGLFDCVNEDHENGFLHRLETVSSEDDEAMQNFHEQCAPAEEIENLFNLAVKELPPVLVECNTIAKDDAEANYLYGLLIRLLTSAVMEGDRRDTAEFMNDAVFPKEVDSSLWQELLAKTESKLHSLSAGTPINAARHKISDLCRNAAEAPSGIYRLNVPTGSGKTLSALRYALAHAAKYNKKRIIFTFPLLSIIEQNSSVIREYTDDTVVLEHHSNVIQEDSSDEVLNRYELLTETWASPIIVTTLVQLLNTMFDGKSSSVRRFHALTNSVIIIDEVQTVPGKLLSLFNLTITFLATVCHATILLCSATQPCQQTLKHPIRANTMDMIRYDPELWNVFKRTHISFGGAYRMESIPPYAAEILKNTSSLLIVCNKKAESEAIYHAMLNVDYNVFHLSAAMCMKHREETLEKLTCSLKQKEKKTVCVATQVIEAGVDISFGAVIRLTAGLDSIIQSAGRCNRNGESDTAGQVFIIRTENEDLSHLEDIKLAQEATEQLLSIYKSNPESLDSDLSSDKAISTYYNYLFQTQRRKNNDWHDYPIKNKSNTLFRLLSENPHWRDPRKEEKQPRAFFFHQAFASAGKLFEVFDNDTTDVIVPWGEGEDIISKLLSERAKYDMPYVKKLLEQSRGYTVSIYSYQEKKLKECGALIPLADNGILLGLNSDYYDKSTGIKIKEASSECNTLMW